MGLLDRLLAGPQSERGGTASSSESASGIWSVPLQIRVPRDARFTFVENVDYDSDYDNAARTGLNFVEPRTRGRSNTWRDDQDRILYDDDALGSGPLLPFRKDVAFHRASGVIATAGFGRTEFYANGALHEWLETVWLRQPGKERFIRVEFVGELSRKGSLDDSPVGWMDGPEPWSLDISPDGSWIAGLWWSGATGAICGVIDVAGAHGRPLTHVRRRDGRNFMGIEEIRFSPDGRWLLIGGPIDDDMITLVSVSAGEVIYVPFPAARSAAWWPHHSPSALLVASIGARGEMRLNLLDLANSRADDLGTVESPPDVRDGEDYRFGMTSLAIGGDGRSLAVLTHLASEREWGFRRPPRPRVATGELIGRQGGVVAARLDHVARVSLDEHGAALVEHRRLRPLDTVSCARVEIDSKLREAAAPLQRRSK